MKFFVIFLFLIFSSFLTLAYGQTQITCHFGNETTPGEEIFEKDLAVRAFVEKYPQANRNNTSESDSTDGTLTFQTQTTNEKIILSIEYWINENGCYRPKTYHYSYDDGQIDVTVRNTLGSFSEIINLVKSNEKKLEDFYPENCSFVDLDYSISDGQVYGICKDNENPSITIQAKANSDGKLQVDIPLKMVYTLDSKDCAISNDFFVMSARGELPYEITPSEIGNLVSIDLLEGPNKISIDGSWIIPDPSPAQYCGIVMGYDSQFLPPKQQTKRDVDLRFIQCNNNFELVVKYSGDPACVKSETVPKLIERGWAKIIPEVSSNKLPPIANPDFKSDLPIIVTKQSANPQKIIVTIGDPTPNGNLLPITTTEITKISSSSKNVEVIFWAFQPFKETKEKDWSFVNDHVFEVVDKNGQDVIDRELFPENNVWGGIEKTHTLVCDYIGKVTAISRSPTNIPLKDNVSETFATYSEIGILPDSHGEYTLEFASLFDQEIILPENADKSASNHNICFLESDESTKAYYDKVVFKLIE